MKSECTYANACHQGCCLWPSTYSVPISPLIPTLGSIYSIQI